MSLDARVPSSVACRIRAIGALRTIAAVGGLALGLTALVGLTGCPRTPPPAAPGTEPTPPPIDRRPAGAGPAQSALLGELCMTGAGGRPGIAPLAARTVSWSSEPTELAAALNRGQAGAFAVLGVLGQRVGVFTPIGAGELAGNASVAMGSYAGSSPCVTGDPGAGGRPADDAACVAATGGCGLAVAAISTGGAFTGVDPPDVAVGGACVSGDGVAVDIDGDGTAEVFPLTAFLDGSRAPAEELTAASAVAAPCTARFSHYGLAIAVDAAIADPRHRVTLDVLGVLDLDGDGRQELVIGLRYAERRTIAVYSAIDSAARLSLIGEVEPWPRS